MKLAAVCVALNESALLAEWIAWHIEIGCDKVIIYDNGSRDDSPDLVRRLRSKLDVELIAWDVKDAGFQNSAYQHAIDNFSQDFDWLAFIDADEFIHSSTNTPFKTILENLPLDASLALNWAVYGSSGFEDRPSGLITRDYLFRASDDFGPNFHTKSVVRTGHPITVTSCHQISESIKFCHPDGTEVSWVGDGVSRNRNGSDILRINHYFVRSKQDWALKLARGYRDIVRGEHEFYLYDQNDLFDQTAALQSDLMYRRHPELFPLSMPTPLRLDPRTTLPMDFESDRYLSANPDVAAAGIDASDHYLRHGRREGRPYK